MSLLATAHADRPSRARSLPFLILLAGMLAAVGCPTTTNDGPGPDVLPFAGQALRLAVTADAEMAAAIRKLASEWKARSGADLEVVEWSEQELLAGERLEADAVIYPSAMLAVLAERGWIKPVPQDLLSDPELAWQDILPTLAAEEAVWGPTVQAVPFGSPVLVCYYRQDLFQKLNKSPPRTWAEYQALAEFFQEREKLADAAPPADAAWCGAIEPVGKGWAGLTLLARAAAYAKHPDYHSGLFDLATMTPLIDRPPFERALGELVAANRAGPAKAKEYGPDEIRQAFWRGECALALTWPYGAEPSDGVTAETDIAAGMVELPGAVEVFNPGEQAWEERRGDEAGRVPLLAAAGRLGSVAQGSAHPEAAFQLLAALSSLEWAPQVCAASRATTLFRKKQVGTPRAWVERMADPQAAQDYAAVVEQSLSQPEFLFALRIPGRERYLAELDAAVGLALTGEVQPADALRHAAERWREITDELGLEAQQRAYERSLGRTP